MWFQAKFDCGRWLLTDETSEVIEMDETYLQNCIFLEGCDNFNSNKQNLLLLLYGYINFIIEDKSMYDKIPLDLIQICMPFCYDLKELNPIKIEWSTKDMQQTTVIPFDNYLPRQLWKMKVIYCDPKDSNPVQIFVGRISINFYKHILKYNDIISLLYMHQNGDNGLLKCGINDELYGDIHQVSVSDLLVSEIMILTGGKTKLSRLLEINSFETDLSKNQIKMKQKVFQRYFK